jgi:anti-sigma factor RsiW
MEKVSAVQSNYQKKITAYIDGALSPTERTEFEAYLAVHPEFKDQIKSKEDEVQLLKSLIPTVSLSHRTLESLDSEIKQSIFNLLKSEPKNFWENLKNRIEDWLNR